jgi:hypothetical protein
MDAYLLLATINIINKSQVYCALNTLLSPYYPNSD